MTTSTTDGTSSEAIDARVVAGRELARRFYERPGVIGAFVHGSSIRPYGDSASDIDITVVVEDQAFASASHDGVDHKIWEAGKKIADVSFYRQSVFAAPTIDAERFRALHARIVFDPTGALEILLAQIASLPPDVAGDRMRIHYFEVLALSTKILSAVKRQRSDVARVLASHLVVSAGRAIFLAQGVWPSPMSWMFDELQLVGTPPNVISALRAVLETPEAKPLRLLRAELDEYLLPLGASFVADPAALLTWIYQTPEGRQAVARWSLPIMG